MVLLWKKWFVVSYLITLWSEKPCFSQVISQLLFLGYRLFLLSERDSTSENVAIKWQIVGLIDDTAESNVN